jgi:flagellar biogenesis protein FliO
MALLQNAGRRKSTGSNKAQLHGLVGWVAAVIRGLSSQQEMSHTQLRLVETLPLGGKRQLMLVSCGGESFLVGGGADSVETIVRVKPEYCLSLPADRDEPCR